MDTIKDFISSTAGFLTALGALMAAIASVVKAVTDYKKQHSPRPPLPPRYQESSKPSAFVVLLKMPAFAIGILLIVASVGIFAARMLFPPLPPHVQLTSAAWDALDKSDYSMAIAKSQECIGTFEGQAIREQKALVENSPPPLGEVNEDEKHLILSHGLLNDVATSYFIMGQALEKLNRIGEAREAYMGAQKFPFARTQDERGWFWSPADAATDRLTQLQ